MPQLDILIALPQIFWMFISFSLFYYMLTYYFLPLFVKSIKSRKQLIELNQENNSNLIKETFNERKLLMKKLYADFSLIRSGIFYDLVNAKFQFKNKPFKQKYLKLTSFLFKASVQSIFYCNSSLLNSINFYPSILNKKIK